MSEQSENPTPADRAAGEAADQRVCQFPTVYDPQTDEWTVCGQPIPAAAGRGRPSDYCGQTRLDPDGVTRVHDRAGAFQRKRDPKARAQAAASPRRAADRPVSGARASFAELLEQLEVVTASHREQLAEILGAAQQIAATAGDADAAVAEVAAVRRAAQEQVDAATARAEVADADAVTARRELARALEDKALAEGAAEDALADRDARLAEAREEVADANAAATRAEQAAEQARIEADARVAQIEQQAREQVRSAETAASERVSQIEHHADEQVRGAQNALSEAQSAQHRAESAQAAAEQSAADARAEADRMRARFDAERVELRAEVQAARDEIGALRTELADQRDQARREREQLRSDHRDEVARVQATEQARAETLQQALTAAHSTIARLESQLNPTTEKGAR